MEGVHSEHERGTTEQIHMQKDPKVYTKPISVFGKNWFTNFLKSHSACPPLVCV